MDIIMGKQKIASTEIISYYQTLYIYWWVGVINCLLSNNIDNGFFHFFKYGLLLRNIYFLIWKRLTKAWS